MPMKIAILEDSKERQEMMRSCLEDRFYQYEVHFFDSALEMIDYLKENLLDVLALSLDHDLDFKQTESGELLDPGTGRDVADFLAKQPPACPIVMHTTNVPAADGMELVLSDAHWQTCRVVPYGDLEWIPDLWFRTIRDVIVDAAATVH